MEPRACVVVDDGGEWQGWVLAWQRTGDTWRALCRYRAPHGDYLLAREHWVPATALRPR